MRKKIISLALALVMALTLLPTAAFAETPAASEYKINAVGFKADGQKANTATGKTDCERSTLWVSVTGPASDATESKQYGVVLEYPADANITVDNDVKVTIAETDYAWLNTIDPGDNAAMIRTTLKHWPDSQGSNKYDGLANGDYKIHIVEYTAPKDTNSKPTEGATLVNDGGKTITLAEVTIDFGTGKTPGDYITQHEDKAFFEVDGTKAKIFADTADLPNADSTDAATALGNLITLKGLTGGTWSYTASSKTFTYTAPAEPGDDTDYSDVKIGNPNLAIYTKYNKETGTNGPWTGAASAEATAGADKTYNVTVTATGLESHNREGNAESVNNPGYWIGVMIPKVDTDRYKQGWGETITGDVFEDPDGVDGDKAGFYWNFNETHAKNDKGYLQVLDSEGTAKATYIITFNVERKVEAPENALTFGKAADATTCFPAEADGVAKTVADMGKFEFAEPDADNNVVVTGTANYMTQKGFNGAVQAEEAGHYLPIKITSAKGGTITITSRSDGAKNGKDHTLSAGTGYETLIWLDGRKGGYTGSNAASLAENTFTVKVSDDLIYTIDFSGVALLPKAVVTDDSVAVVVDPEKAESLGELIKDSNTDATVTDSKAPVKVEGTTDKTLTFTGKDGTSDTVKDSTTVTLPKELVDVVTSNETKANVKVESSAGSVTVPTATLGTVDTTEEASVVVNVAKKTVTDSDLTDVDGVTEENKTAIAGGKAVSVTLTVNGDPVLPESGATNLPNNQAVTITIKDVTANTDYTVLCLRASKLTTFGKYKSSASGELTFKSKHLTDFIAVQGAVADIDPDDGAVNEVTIESITTDAPLYAKVRISGMNAAKVYVVRLATGTSLDGGNMSIFIIDGSSSPYEFYCKDNQNIWVFEADSKASLVSGWKPVEAAHGTASRIQAG